MFAGLWVPNKVLDVWALLGATKESKVDAGDAQACAAWAHSQGALLAARWQDTDLERVLRSSGVAVLRLAGEKNAQAGPVRVAALFSFDGAHPSGELRLYEDQIRAKEDALARAQVGDAQGAFDVTGLHLAHEFFHYLEHIGQVDVVSNAPKVRVAGFLGRHSHRLPGIREVAAHAFARTLVRPPIHPVLLDCVVRAYLSADLDASMAAAARRAEQTLRWLGG